MVLRTACSRCSINTQWILRRETSRCLSIEVDIFAVQQTPPIHTLGCRTLIPFEFTFYPSSLPIMCPATQVTWEALQPSEADRTFPPWHVTLTDNDRVWSIVWLHPSQQKHPDKTTQDEAPGVPASWALPPAHHRGAGGAPLSGFPLCACGRIPSLCSWEETND